MKKNFALALAAIFALLLASAFADNDIEPADILYERTTIHANSNYDETPLSDAEVTLILNAGFSAPTGGNQRSTNFFVITDREVMKVIQTGHPYSQPLNTAPLVIVVAADEANCRYPELHEMDAGLAAGAMQVQATEMGLSSCVLSIFPQDERVNAVRQALSMPETFKPVLMVAFGHPAVDVVAGASVQNYKAEQVHYNAYQAAFTSDVAALAAAQAEPDND